VVDDAGHVVFSSHANATPIFPVKDGASQIDFFETPPGHPNISGASLRKELNGRPVFVQVAEDLGHRDVLIDDVVAGFFHRVGWITIPILLVLLAADIVIFRRAVRPLLRASGQAERISPMRIDVRLPTDEIPNEILPLVVAVNQALDRLEQGFRRQREFAADAAHELRTPLAILRTRIETMPDKIATDALHRDVESMSRVVSQLLDAAELETAVIGKDERADLSDVCVGVAEFIAPLAIAQGKTIALSGSEGPIVINGNAEMLRRAVRNLVENALNHTPDGTAVEIVVGEQGTISVLDEGDGIPTAKRELIFQRFWRRDHERAGGAGLGLSIVKRIVDAHGGTIAVENCPTGGANFTMRFALAEHFRHRAGVGDEPSMFAASAPLAPPV
jgi:signal transduction histidine kinase